MQAGFASVDIAPPIGSDIPRGFSPRVSTGVRMPLEATACMLRMDAGPPMAVVGVDAVSVPDTTVREAPRRIGALFIAEGLPGLLG